MILQEDGIQRIAGVAILTSAKTDFKIKKAMREKGGHFGMTQETLPQEEITPLHIMCTQHGAQKCIKQLTELKGETNKNVIIVGDLNTPFTAIHRPSEQESQRGNVGLT